MASPQDLPPDNGGGVGDLDSVEVGSADEPGTLLAAKNLKIAKPNEINAKYDREPGGIVLPHVLVDRNVRCRFDLQKPQCGCCKFRPRLWRFLAKTQDGGQ